VGLIYSRLLCKNEHNLCRSKAYKYTYDIVVFQNVPLFWHSNKVGFIKQIVMGWGTVCLNQRQLVLLEE